VSLEPLSVSTNLGQKGPLIVSLGRHHCASLQVVIGSCTRENGYGVTSGLRVAEALRRCGWQAETILATDSNLLLQLLVQPSFDVVVPVGFGAPCEDGHVFATARLAGIPCAGPTPAAGSIMLDKSITSHLVDALFSSTSGVRSPSGCTLARGLSAAEMMFRIQRLTPPLVVKPNFSGSSDSLYVAATHAEALTAVCEIIAYEGKVCVQVLEHPIAHEVSCTVLDTIDGPQFLPIVELRRDDVDVLGAAEKFGCDGLNRHIIPARLRPETAAKLKEVVLTLQEKIGAMGLTRTDVLVLPDDTLVVLELNAIPGLLESSIACDAARTGGICFDDLCLKYAESAYLPRAEPRIWKSLHE
jgi:D-alanine-D-alanine ligase